MQRCAPTRQRLAVRLGIKAGDQRSNQQLLHQTHARMRRHFKPAQLQQPEPAGRAVGRIQLVDTEFGAVGVAGNIGQQVAHQAVNQPGLRYLAGRHLRQRNLQFIQRLMPGFVNPWCLTGRADKHAGKQVRQARMVLPEGQHARQQVRPAQER